MFLFRTNRLTALVLPRVRCLEDFNSSTNWSWLLASLWAWSDYFIVSNYILSNGSLFFPLNNPSSSMVYCLFWSNLEPYFLGGIAARARLKGRGVCWWWILPFNSLCSCFNYLILSSYSSWIWLFLWKRLPGECSWLRVRTGSVMEAPMSEDTSRSSSF